MLVCNFKIERQLNAYLHRVEDVLGKGWESHVEGQRLKEDGDNFKQKLDTQGLFEDWSRKVSSRSKEHVFHSDKGIGYISVMMLKQNLSFISYIHAFKILSPNLLCILVQYSAIIRSYRHIMLQ